MKYLVMETHPAYAVVLDEQGRFLKAAHLPYQVGETVEEVVALLLPPPRQRLRPAWGIGSPISPPMGPCAFRSTPTLR